MKIRFNGDLEMLAIMMHDDSEKQKFVQTISHGLGWLMDSGKNEEYNNRPQFSFEEDKSSVQDPVNILVCTHTQLYIIFL